MGAYGYARVSTKEQNEDRQFVVLREASISEQDIFMDEQFGKDFKRPAIQKTGETVKDGRLALHCWIPGGART